MTENASTMRLSIADQCLINTLAYLTVPVCLSPEDELLATDVLREISGRVNRAHHFIGQLAVCADRFMGTLPGSRERAAEKQKTRIELEPVFKWRMGLAHEQLTQAKAS